MYYESRTHELKPVTGATEAAELIKTCKGLYSNNALCYTSANGEFIIVPDGHIDNPFLEVAFIKKTGNEYTQIESITAGWINTADRLADCFTESELSTFNRKANLILGEPKGNEIAWHTCGCCGEGFKGNVKEQLKFDQDSGYGICKSCEIYYK